MFPSQCNLRKQALDTAVELECASRCVSISLLCVTSCALFTGEENAAQRSGGDDQKNLQKEKKRKQSALLQNNVLVRMVRDKGSQTCSPNSHHVTPFNMLTL